MVQFAEGTPVFVQCPQEAGFKMTGAQLEKAITPKTKWLILNSPSNPTGGAYTEAEMKSITDVLMKHPHVYLMTDDIYEHLVYDGFKQGDKPKMLDEPASKLVTYLDNKNGWRRDNAQKQIVILGDKSVVPALKQIVLDKHQLCFR